VKTVIYTRTQFPDITGIDEDIHLCTRWIQRHGHELAGVYADNGYSSLDLDRPRLSDLFADAGTGRFEAVVVLAAITLASNVDLMETILTRLADQGVRVFTIAGRELHPPTEDSTRHPCLAEDAWPYLRLLPKAPDTVQ
jgi:DNA invertase Pin-like site-specific DNA recombinase